MKFKVMAKEDLENLTKTKHFNGEIYHKMIEEVEDYAILLLNKDGYIQNWNKGAEKIKGYKAEEVIGKNFCMFYTEEDNKSGHPKKLIKKAFEEGKATDEGWRVRKDGSKFWGSIVITALHDDLNEVIGFTKVTRDLTERKFFEEDLLQRKEELERKNEELRKSEERYHKMVEEVEDYAILLLDEKGNIQNWNKGAERIKGYEPGEIIGKNFRTFYTEEDRKRNRPEELLKIAADKGKAMDEGWRVRKDGTMFWGSIVITALHNTSGNVIGFTKVTRDLTERKIAEENLLKLNVELESFSYSISHDLRVPLRAIYGFTQILIEDYAKDLPNDAISLLNNVKSNAKKMSDLIDGLLEFARLGRNEPQKVEVNLQEIVNEVVNELSIQEKDRDIDINIKALPPIYADRIAIKQVIVNLISNALKYSRKKNKTRIEVGTEEKGDETIYYVKDNGVGFNMEYVNKVFGVFQRLHSETEYEGAGVGLAITHRIIQKHGGKIWVESKEDIGTTFYFTLNPS